MSILLQRLFRCKGMCLSCIQKRHLRAGNLRRELLEEQKLPSYHLKEYYPVKIGETLGGRYKIITKLGYGAYSTVWLAKDLIPATTIRSQYRAIKVCIRDAKGQTSVSNELHMLERLGKFADADRNQPGLDFIRLAIDTFKIDGLTGSHHCIVTEPQGCSLRDLQRLFPNARLPKLLVKSVLHRLLFSVNWLHAMCAVVHTALTRDRHNTSECTYQDLRETSFNALETDELESPSVPVFEEGKIVYESRAVVPELSGMPILTDFGQMHLAEPPNTMWAMPDLYRAPEILFGLPWGFPADVWSLGIMTLELLEGRNVFDPIDRENKQYVLPLAVSQYMSLLGSPPLAMIKNSPLIRQHFDDQGTWTSDPPIPKTCLEDFVTTIHGEEKALFLNFIRRILTWDSEARATSNELIEDEWLMMPVDD